MASFTVRSYSVTVSNCASPYAYVMLFDADAGSQSNYRVRLDFSQLRETNTYSLVETGTFVDVQMNFKLLQGVVDLLRNEKPLTCTWNTAYQIFQLGTGDEPVGEEEFRRFVGSIKRSSTKRGRVRRLSR